MQTHGQQSASHSLGEKPYPFQNRWFWSRTVVSGQELVAVLASKKPCRVQMGDAEISNFIFSFFCWETKLHLLFLLFLHSQQPYAPQDPLQMGCEPWTMLHAGSSPSLGQDFPNSPAMSFLCLSHSFHCCSLGLQQAVLCRPFIFILQIGNTFPHMKLGVSQEGQKLDLFCKIMGRVKPWTQQGFCSHYRLRR